MPNTIYKKTREHKLRPHYDSVLMLAPDGKVLATVGQKRMNWYVSRGLAVQAEPTRGFDCVFRLLFEPPKAPAMSRPCEVRKNICVVCGASEHLTVHHIVPRFIRRHMPHEHKNAQHLWCVLLCQKHHDEAEAVYAAHTTQKPEYKNALSEHAVLINPLLLRIKALSSIVGGAFPLVQEHAPLRAKKLLDDAGLLCLPARDDAVSLLRACREEAEESWRVYSAEVILQMMDSFGGVEGTKMFFRELFLSMEPKFLPLAGVADFS